MIALNSSVYSLTQRCVGWGCILNCFIIPFLPCFPAFHSSAIPTSHSILNVIQSCNNYCYQWLHLSLNITLFDYKLLNMPTQLIGIWWNKTWGIILKWVCPTVSTIAYQECDCYLQCTREYLLIAIFNPSECYLETLYNILVLEMSEWYMEYSRMHNTKALSIWMYSNIPPIILSTVQHISHNQGMSGQLEILHACLPGMVISDIQSCFLFNHIHHLIQSLFCRLT